MKTTRLERLADLCEALDEEIRNHEFEVRRHGRLADQKRKQLESAYRELCAETRVMEDDPDYYENTPIPVSSLSAYTDMVVDCARSKK